MMSFCAVFRFLIITSAIICTRGIPQIRHNALWAEGNVKDIKLAWTQSLLKRADGDDVTKYIVGGKDAPDGKHPYYAKMYVNETFICAGTILDANLVLTSYDCFFQEYIRRLLSGEGYIDTESWTVVVGDFDPHVVEAEEQTFEIDNSYDLVDMAFASLQMKPDTLILRMATNITFGSNVQPVDLPRGFADERALMAGDTCYALGLGLVSQDPDVNATRLQELPVQMKGNKVCSIYLWQGDWSREYLCSTNRGSGICNMDRGGPVMCDRADGSTVQVGIISYGTRSCDVGLSVYYRALKSKQFYNALLRQNV